MDDHTFRKWAWLVVIEISTMEYLSEEIEFEIEIFVATRGAEGLLHALRC